MGPDIIILTADVWHGPQIHNLQCAICILAPALEEKIRHRVNIQGLSVCVQPQPHIF